VNKKEEPITCKSLREKRKQEEEWNKAHPLRAKLNYIWWWIRYGIWSKIEDIPLNVKTFVQRGKRGWAESDVWGFHRYLADVIPEGLRWLKENKHGVPSEFCWDKETGKEIPFEEADKKWEEVLDKMLKGFDIIEKLDEGEILFMSYTEWDDETYKELCELVNKWQKDSDPHTREIMAKHVMTKEEAKEYEESFRLLGKHFLTLWD